MILRGDWKEVGSDGVVDFSPRRVSFVGAFAVVVIVVASMMYMTPDAHATGIRGETDCRAGDVRIDYVDSRATDVCLYPDDEVLRREFGADIIAEVDAGVHSGVFYPDPDCRPIRFQPHQILRFDNVRMCGISVDS